MKENGTGYNDRNLSCGASPVCTEERGPACNYDKKLKVHGGTARDLVVAISSPSSIARRPRC